MTRHFKKIEECVMKPRICLVSPYQNAYSETFIRAHIERLPAHVTMLHRGMFSQFQEDKRRLFPLPLVMLKKVLPGFSKVYGLFSEAKANTFVNFIDKSVLSRYLKKSRFQAVLAEYGPTGVAVMDACHKAGVPLIVHFHGFDAADHSILEEYSETYQRLFAKAGAIIAVSRDMEKQLLVLGAPADRVYYNPCGVDCSLFSGTKPSLNKPIFLAVGRFVDKKAPYLTLMAFQKVEEAYPQAQLIMVGNGILWEACKQLAEALKISDKVTFSGPLPHIELAAAMRRVRVFVQHSLQTTYGDLEGTPVAVLEAGASALPVVSTRHAGIKDVVIHGETGFLVDEGDIDGMAEYMLMLAKDAHLAETLGQRARENICANFSMEKSIGRLWEIIESLIPKY